MKKILFVAAILFVFFTNLCVIFPSFVKAEVIPQIAAGYTQTVVLKSDGTIWGWGDNAAGKLGDGTTTQRLSPVQEISGASDWVAIAADSHTVALKSDGTLWAWGYNGYGELGDGTTSNRSWPVVVTGLYNIAALAEGENFAFLMR